MNIKLYIFVSANKTRRSVQIVAQFPCILWSFLTSRRDAMGAKTSLSTCISYSASSLASEDCTSPAFCITSLEWNSMCSYVLVAHWYLMNISTILKFNEFCLCYFLAQNCIYFALGGGVFLWLRRVTGISSYKLDNLHCMSHCKSKTSSRDEY